jgi:LysR family transcriptional regulator, hydrogen peroxide-inducible genes activator
MELHQLRYFVAVAHTGNFSRAAERCHVSQPSLSQQILKLERRLGQPLLNRLGRRAVLTDAGRVLLDRATAILAAVEDAERRLLSRGLQGGRLSVGAIPTIAPYLLPAALEAFARRCPNIELAVQEDVTRHLLAGVVEGELDLAIVALPITEARLQAEPLLTEPLLVAMPRGHPLTRRRKIHIRDLGEERFILLNEMHCLGEQTLSLCRAHDCQPRIACRSAQIATVQALIALGHGISLLPEMARRADRNKRLVYHSLANKDFCRTIAAVWHRQSYHSPAAECFLANLRQVTHDLRSSASPHKPM